MDAAAGLQRGWSPAWHGRSAFGIHFDAAGANIDVIEQCSARMPANRHAHQVERREMLQAWADRVNELPSEIRAA